MEYDADVETFSAESSREQKARLDAITPSDSRLGGVVVRVAAVETEEAPALEKGVKTDDVKVESSKTETKAEEKFVDSVEISASENGQDRKRMLNRARVFIVTVLTLKPKRCIKTYCAIRRPVLMLCVELLSWLLPRDAINWLL